MITVSTGESKRFKLTGAASQKVETRFPPRKGFYAVFTAVTEGAALQDEGKRENILGTKYFDPMLFEMSRLAGADPAEFQVKVVSPDED